MMHFPCSQSRKEISLLELLCEGQEQQHRHPTDTHSLLLVRIGKAVVTLEYSHTCCHICNKSFACKTTNMSNMWKNLVRSHHT